MNRINYIAEAFLNKESMTPKKLQKLLYYYKAWGLALYDDDLLEGSEFEAWVHGPVSEEIYNKYKVYGWNEIPLVESKVELEEREIDLLESVWVTYGDLSANELEALTHTELPWIKARAGYSNNERCKVEIEHEDMKNYYKNIYIGD